MAKRLTDTDIWDKEWFMKLSPKLKCLVKFVRDKCDLAGVWNPNWTLANIYIGQPVNEKELLSIDEGNQFEKLQSGKIFCIDFIQFQNGKLSNKSPIHIKILSLLEQHGIPYTYPIHRVFNTPIVDVVVGVVVEEEVIVKEKFNFKKSLIEYGFTETLVDDWLLVRKNKKATNTETAFKKFTSEVEKTSLSPNEVMEKCIEKSWSGFNHEWIIDKLPLQKEEKSDIILRKTNELLRSCDE